MSKSNAKYAPLTQHEVTAVQPGENGRTSLCVRGEGSEMEESLCSPVVDSPDEVDFRSYKRRSEYSCVRICSYCNKIFRSMTNREKLLSLLVLVLAILMLSMFGFEISRSKDPQPSTCRRSNITVQPCTTRACINVASKVALSLDESVDPCQDFYEFACGGWEESNLLPSGESRWSGFNALQQSNHAIMKNVLELNTTQNNSIAEKKAKIFYESCIDLEAINKRGAQPLLTMLEEVGGWPVLNNWDESSFEFNATIQQYFPYSIYPFFSIGVNTDSKHSNSNIVIVGESGLSLGTRDFYVNKTIEDDKILHAYLDYMTEVATLLGAKDPNITRFRMKEVLELEKKLAIISLPLVEMRNEEKNYHRMVLADLQDIAPAVDWSNLVPELFLKVANETVGMDEPVITFSREYLGNFSDIVYQTPKRILGNYFGWRFVHSFVGALGQPFLEALNKFHKVQYGSNMNCVERWRRCLNTVDSVLGLAVGRLFVQKKFDKTSKSSAEEMVREIKASFQKNLPKTSWMDPVTRKKASEKCSAVEDMIGFDDKILNITYVNEKYKNLIVDANKGHFEHHVSVVRYITVKELKNLRKPVKRKEWTITPPTVNAYYSPTKNIIVFPAGILQPPFYSSNFPKSINYGGIGIVVGHELTHGFDDQGRQYDLNGNLNNWWQKDTLAKFKKKAHCMVEQYGSFNFGGAQVNGVLTLGENIADNGGVRLAYNAYQVWKKANGSSETQLPSLNYTHDQLFFISFAQLWCSVTTPQFRKHQVLVDMHSPPKARVIGTLSNFEEFSKAFSCPKGSPMNPAKKCKVW
ncbi:endothelin-converting enzyme 2 isoform X1 [Ciona intestinalis]